MNIVIKPSSKYTITKYPPRYRESPTEIIRSEMAKNFNQGGRPNSWKQNTKATLDWKRRRGFSLKPNEQTGEMREIVTSGRIYTRRSGGGIELKYYIQSSSSYAPEKFKYAQEGRRGVLPFGNRYAKPVNIPARKFDYIGDKAMQKLANIYRGKLEQVVLNIPLNKKDQSYTADWIMKEMLKIE